eukprot:1081141-Rhodomonas_salina.2
MLLPAVVGEQTQISVTVGNNGGQLNPTPSTPYTLHPTPYILHPTPYTLNPLHPTPYTLHPALDPYDAMQCAGMGLAEQAARGVKVRVAAAAPGTVAPYPSSVTARTKVRVAASAPGTVLRASYALSGTFIAYRTSEERCRTPLAYAATHVRICCYITDLAYAATRHFVRYRGRDRDHPPGMGLRVCYAMSGTDLAYAAISLCDTKGHAAISLRNALYCRGLSCYCGVLYYYILCCYARATRREEEVEAGGQAVAV